jgi:hypothetical protein
MKTTDIDLGTLQQGVIIAERKQSLQQQISDCDRQLGALFGGVSQTQTNGNGHKGSARRASVRTTRAKRRWTPEMKAKLSRTMRAHWKTRRRGKDGTNQSSS